MAATAATWRVMLSKTRWDQRKYEKEWYRCPEQRGFRQSLGRANMTTVPRRGDTVFFIYGGTAVMEGRVETDVITDDDWYRDHSCNLGVTRHHSDYSHKYVMVEITRIYEETDRVRVRPTGQRTWIRKELADIRV